MKDNINISIDNYEAYFLDYHEGSLSLDLVKELMDFLSQHPELKEEFESFESVTLNDSEGIKYDGKQMLKKQANGINQSNFDEYAVQYVEGTISAAKQQELNAFIRKNLHYQQELELYTKTKLTPDVTIVFEDKPSLKKGTKRPVVWYYWSAAASVALIIGAYFMFHKNETLTENNTVQNITVKDSNIVADHTTKAIDTVSVIRKTTYFPVNNRMKKNTPVIVKVQQAKQNKNVPTIPNNASKDSSAIAVNKGGNENNIAPVKKQIPIRPGNDSVAFNKNIPDTSSTHKPLIILKDTQPVVATVNRKKRGKFLVFLATAACKGLHKITGQHIELEKHYAADTTTIVAYQLDLGNKKIEFPVKE